MTLEERLSGLLSHYRQQRDDARQRADGLFQVGAYKSAETLRDLQGWYTKFIDDLERALTS